MRRKITSSSSSQDETHNDNIHNNSTTAPTTTGTKTTTKVCIPGGGFSGYWFTLGRIHSITNPLQNKQYYCYSSGCLGIVAALANYTKDEMYNIAHDAQIQWQSGSIKRVDVVGLFIDNLINGGVVKSAPDDDAAPSKLKNQIQKDSRFLSSLNIISTKREKEGISSNSDNNIININNMIPSIRKPSSLEELRLMLLQTTWIPYILGNDLYHLGHMDGAFTTTSKYHPLSSFTSSSKNKNSKTSSFCDVSVGLPYDFDLFLNVINANLGKDKVEQFWNDGLAYGL